MSMWEIMPDAEFDEIAAGIIMSPQLAIAHLEHVCIKRERDRSTLLHLFAGGENCEELVTYLIKAGIPVDEADSVGWTPLLEAAQEGRITNCELLLAKGATPDLACSLGITPLKAAITAANADMTKWLLDQPGTWSNRWDDELFAMLLQHTPDVATVFLDKFAIERGHTRAGKTAVKYIDLRFVYGDPSVSVERSALAIAVQHHQSRIVLSHRVFKYTMKVKWETFARAMFFKELAAFVGLLSSYYVTTIWADPNWIEFVNGFDYWVAVSRAVAWICCLYLLFVVEYREYRGSRDGSYAKSFWNWVEVSSYLVILTTIPLEFAGKSTNASRNSLLAFILVTLWINMLQYLQISEKTGLLIAMMGRMVRDVVQFFVIYAVFILGFSGALYLLFRGASGYENFINSFITVFLMLFGQITYDPFGSATGWTWHMSNLLLFIYLIGVVIMLLNILIAMMATTYSMISDSAEDRIWLSYAKTILRMEGSLDNKVREKQFEALVLDENKETVVGMTVSEPQGHGAVVVDANQSIERKRSKLERTASLVHKINLLTEKAKHANDAQVHAHGNALKARGSPLTTMHLTALKQSLMRKSAFDFDEDTDLPLRLLQDGVRYESPSKQQAPATPPQSAEPSNAQLMELVKNIPLQIQELGDKIQELEAENRAWRGVHSGVAHAQELLLQL